jgi:excisionase family DNA binding protein
MHNNTAERTRIETENNESKLPARLLPIGEVARFLGVHSTTIRRWEKGGLLKSYSIGLRHNLRFKQEDVLNFLQRCRDKRAHMVSQNGGLDKRKPGVKSKRR